MRDQRKEAIPDIASLIRATLASDGWQVDDLSRVVPAQQGFEEVRDANRIDRLIGGPEFFERPPPHVDNLIALVLGPTMVDDRFGRREGNNEVLLEGDFSVAASTAVFAIPNHRPKSDSRQAGLLSDLPRSRTLDRLVSIAAAAGRRPTWARHAGRAGVSVFDQQQPMARR